MPDGSGRLRHACNECHRTKTRCSGENPCEGCFNSGTECCYSVSARLGRPRGVKNRRPNGDGDAVTSRQKAQGSGHKRLNSGQDSRPQSPPRQSTEFVNQLNGQMQSPVQPPAQVTDAYGTTQGAQNPPVVDTTMYDSAYDVPFNFAETKLLWDAPSFDIPQIPLPNKDVPDNQQSPLKARFSSNNITMDDILPKSFWVSPVSSPLETLQSASYRLDPFSAKPSPPKSSPQHFDPYTTKPPTPQSAALQPPFLSSSSSLPCTCFQRNADVLCALKTSSPTTGAEDADQSQSLGSILLSVQDALEAWRALVECRGCSANTEQECLFLALMSIRVLLLRVQAQLPGDADLLPPASRSSESHQQGRFSMSYAHVAHAHRVTIGEHELGERDRWLVMQVLLLNTVRRIRAAMGCFGEVLERKRNIALANRARRTLEEEAGLDHVSQMLQNLGELAGNLEKGFTTVMSK